MELVIFEASIRRVLLIIACPFYGPFQIQMARQRQAIRKENGKLTLPI